MKCALVIAAYDEAGQMDELTSRIISTLDAQIPQWTLIYVVEGTDSTNSIAQSYANKRSEIRVIYNPAPSGLGRAFRKGFDAVPLDTDVVVTMDADLNHQPEEIPRLVSAMFRRRADIVVGSRKVPGSVTEGAPYWKTALSNTVNRFMTRVIGMPVADQTSGFRVYSYGAFRKLSFDSSGFAFLPEILLQAHKLRLVIVEEPIRFIFRKTGESKMKLIPTARSYIAMLFSLKGKPSTAHRATFPGFVEPQGPEESTDQVF